jgi:hypothetical protein
MLDREPIKTEQYHISWASKDGAWWVALPDPAKDNQLMWTMHRYDSKADALAAVEAGLEYA